MESKIWCKQTCLQKRNTLTDIEVSLEVAKGEGGGEGRHGLNVCAKSALVENQGSKPRVYCSFSIPMTAGDSEELLDTAHSWLLQAE